MSIKNKKGTKKLSAHSDFSKPLKTAVAHFQKEIDSNLMLINKTAQQMYGTSTVSVSNSNLSILHRRKVKWRMEHSGTGVNTIIRVKE